MTTVKENDLKRLEDLIIGGQKSIETRLTGVETRLTTIETRLTTIETDQTEIKSDIKALEIGQTEIQGQIVGLQREISDLRVSVGRVEGSLQIQQPFIQKIPDLAEKVGELKNWRQIVIIAVTAVISSTVTWFIRSENLKP